MNKLVIFSSIVMILLSACREHHDAPPRVASAASSSSVAASAVVAASESASASDVSPIVAQILNSPQEQDILATSKQAMDSVSASDIRAASATAASAASQAPAEPEDDRPKVTLPPACEAYYQRVDKCFAKQPDHEELQQMNADARVDLATDKPNDQTCVALNRSFDALARNLQCQ